MLVDILHDEAFASELGYLLGIGSIARLINASRLTRALLDFIIALRFQRAQWAADRNFAVAR